MVFLSPDKEHSEKSIIYSFGLCLWSITTGLELDDFEHWPEQWTSYEGFVNNKKQGHIPDLTKVPSEKLKDLIRKCLDIKPYKRPELSEVIEALKNHPTVFRMPSVIAKPTNMYRI
jgi:hypothetical protein